MPTRQDVLALLPERNTILCWDLLTHTRHDIPFHFAVPHSFCSNIFIFPDASLVCIQENGASTADPLFRLTYFRLPLTSESLPLHTFYDDDHLWTHDHTLITRANNAGTVCWMKTKFTSILEFYLYTPRLGG